MNEELVTFTITEKEDKWAQIFTDPITPSTKLITPTLTAPNEIQSQEKLIVTLSLESQKTLGQPNLELRLMNENSLENELVKYLTSHDIMMRRIKKLYFKCTLPNQTLKNLLDNLSKRYQYRKSLKYLRGTELVSDVVKVYLAKPQNFSMIAY